MKLLLLQIDKTQESWLAEGISVYLRRLQNYTALETKTISMPKNVRQRSFAEQKELEARAILSELQPDDYLVLLDERGKIMSSVDFSKFLQQKQNASVKRLVFAIGGPYGFDEKIYERANFKLSFSAMTFSHQMVRLIFAEQLYRAFTILRGEKYHHDG